MSDHTKKLSAYLAGLQYEHIPAEVTERAKMLTMHCVGAALAGRDLYTGRGGISTARDLVGSGGELTATLWGCPEKLPLMGAIFANSTMADTMDWEDCSWTGHPTASMVPVSLCMSEALHKSGRDCLTAMIGGFELYQRIAGYVQPPKGFDLVNDGWGLTTWQIFAASMPAGKLMECSEEEFNLLIGATGCSTFVANAVIQQQMSDFYHLQFGFDSLNGALLARMVKRGEVDNIYDILDVKSGYAMMMRGFANDGWLDRNVGTEYMFNEILFKHWPANMWIQTPLDCLDAIVREHGLRADDIETIAYTPSFQFRNKFCPEGYKSVKEGEFSTPYCLGAYLVDPNPGPHWYSEQMLKNPQLLGYAARVRPDIEHTVLLKDAFTIYTEGSFPGVEMRVTLKDGTVHTGSCQFPKGHPRNPYDWAQAERDFRIGARSAGLTARKTERFITLCQALETLPDVAELMECLRTEGDEA